MSTRMKHLVTRELTGDVFQASFDRHERAMHDLAPEELIHINTDVPTVITNVFGALPAMTALRDQLIAEITHFDVREFDAIESRAGALAQAHGAYLAAAAPPRELVALNDEAAALRETFLGDARALVGRGLLNPNCLDAFKSKSGYRNVAFDLLALATLFRTEWKAIEGHTGLRAIDLEKARSLSDRLVRAVGARSKEMDVVAEAADVRQRAYTLLVRAYDEARTCIAFLRRHEGDADSIAPSLFAGRGGRRKHADVSPAPGPPPAAVPATPTAPVAGPTPAATVAVTSAARGASTAIGMPASRPFV